MVAENPAGVTNVVPIETARRTVDLKRLAKIDPDIREFLKILRDHDLREQAVRLLEAALTRKRAKIRRPTV